MDPVALIAGIAGIVLLWGGIKNHNPLEAIKLALQGQDPNGAAPLALSLSSPAGATAQGSGTIPPAGAVKPPAGDSPQSGPGAYKSGPNTYVVPILPGEAQPIPGVM